MDVVVGDPRNGADGATSGGEMNETPGAVTGVLAHPGAPRDGLKTWGLVRSARYSSYGKMVDNEFGPMDVACSLQPRTPYSFREPKVNPRPRDVVSREGTDILHLCV